jgi:hypothetical protein
VRSPLSLPMANYQLQVHTSFVLRLHSAFNTNLHVVLFQPCFPCHRGTVPLNAAFCHIYMLTHCVFAKFSSKGISWHQIPMLGVFSCCNGIRLSSFRNHFAFHRLVSLCTQFNATVLRSSHEVLQGGNTKANMPHL